MHLPAGNRPSLSILLPELNAYTLGQLLRWAAVGRTEGGAVASASFEPVCWQFAAAQGKWCNLTCLPGLR